MRVLTYDDLPAGSDVRREFRDDGTIVITVPAGDVPQAARRAAAHMAFASGALFSIGFLAAAFAVFALFVRQNRISGAPFIWAVAFFAIFCTAIVALVSWVRYRMAIERTEIARRQSTILAISRERALIETTGPFGVAGFDLAIERIAKVDLKRSRMLDNRGHAWRMWHLELTLSVGRSIALLPGRDPTELRWIAGTIREAVKRG